MNKGDTHGRPADRTGASGRGAEANPAHEVEHTCPREVEFEYVLAWGPGDDRVVDRSARRSDLALRLATGVVAAGALALVAMGAANHGSPPASDSTGVRHPAVTQETRGLMGPNLLPSCLVEWPDHRHVSCPPSQPKPSRGEPDCYYPNRVCALR
jgi:hypothetical protein